MDIYDSLNKITEYIEKNIDQKIDYNKLGAIMGVNKITMQSIFSLLTGITLSEYIRKRRLSLASIDLYNGEKIIDVAIKYQYNNATSFSRAFKSFHGIKPSEVKELKTLKNYSRPIFKYNVIKKESITYQIITQEELVLYGFSVNTDNNHIKKDAPHLFSKIQKEIGTLYGNPDYGMVTYKNDKSRKYCNNYFVLYNKKLPIADIKKVVIPKSKFLMFRIPSQDAKAIQKMSDYFYFDFLPSCKFNLNNIPELEYYHDEIVDFLVPIE